MHNNISICRLAAVFVIFTTMIVCTTLDVRAAVQAAQQSYATAEEAAAALAAAARTHNLTALTAVLGPDSGKLLSSGDRYADQEREARFAAAYDEKHTLVALAEGRMQLDVGKDDWPMPIPIVQKDGRWLFDTKAGAQEIIDRRIGRDELSAIRVSLAYVDAQKDYFARMKQETGTGFYAQRLISTPGHKDGLYWPASGGTESPLESVVSQAEDEGYAGAFTGTHPVPYQGYYFRVLRAQGSEAPGGAMNYVRSGQMSEGFALIAWPAQYGSSGVMTFQVGQDGVVFQKDLGPNTTREVATINRFDPDLSWARVDVTNQ